MDKTFLSGIGKRDILFLLARVERTGDYVADAALKVTLSLFIQGRVVAPPEALAEELLKALFERYRPWNWRERLRDDVGYYSPREDPPPTSGP